MQTKLDKLIELNIALINALLETETSFDNDISHVHHIIDASEDDEYHYLIGKLEELTADPEFSGMDK